MIRVAFSQQPHQHKQVDVEQAEEGDEHGHGGGGAGVDDRLAGGDKTAVCKNCKTGFADRRHKIKSKNNKTTTTTFTSSTVYF